MAKKPFTLKQHNNNGWFFKPMNILAVANNSDKIAINIYGGNDSMWLDEDNVDELIDILLKIKLKK